MKKVLLLVIIFSACCSTKAQSVFAPVGSTWNYTWYEHTGAYQGPETLYYTGDTIIGVINHKKIAKAYSYSCMCPNWLSGTECCLYTVVERNDSIFDGNMQLQYSFSQPIGDSIVFNPGGGPGQFKIVLDSLKTQFICSQNRRVLYYSKYQGFCKDSLRIIEGIGPVNGYLYTEAIGNCDMGPGQHYFNCANIVTCNYPASCSTAVSLAVVNNESLSNAVKILKKDHLISVTFSKAETGELMLYDITGRIYYSEKFDKKEIIEIPTLPLKSGVYFLSIKNSEGDLYKKIFIE